MTSTIICGNYRIAQLQETTTDSNQHVTEFQETNADLEMEQEVVMLMNEFHLPFSRLPITFLASFSVIISISLPIFI